MASLTKAVEEEIQKFRENNLVCKNGKFCLPLYNISERINDRVERIESHDEQRNKVKDIFQKSISFFELITEEERRELYQDFYRLITQNMKAFLYPGEEKINPGCENHNCAAYSVLTFMTNGGEMNEFIMIQSAAMAVFKYKESERVKRDIGWNTAAAIWAERKVNFKGKEIPLAQIFRECYDEEKERNGHFCLDKFSKIFSKYLPEN